MAKVITYQTNLMETFGVDLPWEMLSGTNILVTGATGLIGGCLIDVLMSNPQIDYSVYALGRNVERANKRFSEYWNEDKFHFIHADVCDSLNSQVDFQYIIHAASNASPNFFLQKPVEVIKSNILGITNLLEYGKKHGLKRLLYVSTGEVYGQSDKDIIDEGSYGYVDILNTRSCYPSSKRAAETLAISYMSEYRTDVVIARPCHIYGPFFTEQDNRVYAQFFRNVLNGEDIVLKSSGLQYRSWCYVMDCVTALLYILFKGKSGEAYNIADKNSILAIRTLAEKIAKLSGRSVVVKEPTKDEVKQFTNIRHAVFDTSKIEALGWKCAHGVDENLSSVIRTMLAEGNFC